MWIATDKDGTQTWFKDKPERGDGMWREKGDTIWRGILPIYNVGYYGYFSEQTWEDEPIEVVMIPKDFITEFDKLTDNICSYLLGRPNDEATQGDILVSMKNVSILLNNYVGDKR